MQRLLAIVVTLALATIGLNPLAANANGAALQLRVVISDSNGDGSLSAAERRAGVPLEGTVSVDVDWGDGSAVESFTTAGFKPHEYSAAGTYDILITGELSHFGFTGNAEDRSDGAGGFADDEMAKITQLISWGSLGLSKLEYAFSDAINLISVPDYIPSTVTDVHALFIGATSFNDPDIVNWDVSNIQKFKSMFWDAENFNQPIGSWDTSSATDMSFVFNRASSFNQPLTNWTTTSVTTFQAMFQGASSFNQSLAHFDLGAVTAPDIFVINQTAMDPGNLAESIVGWYRKDPAGDLNLNLSGVEYDSLANAALEALEDEGDEYLWNITGGTAVGTTVAINPSKRVNTGFSGLELRYLNGPILDPNSTSLSLGESEEFFDYNEAWPFGSIWLENDSVAEQVGKYDYRRCSRTADGLDVTYDEVAMGDLVVVSCETFPIVLSLGASVTLDVTMTFQGSFIGVEVEVIETEGDVAGLGPVGFFYGGDGFNGDSTTLVTPFSDFEGRSGAFVHSDVDDQTDMPVGAFLGEGMTVLDYNLNPYTNNNSDEDEIWFGFGEHTLTSSTNLMDLTMFFVDWYGPRDSDEPDFLDRLNEDRGAALEFAQEIVSAPLAFGTCLPTVMDSIVPAMIDECTGTGDPTPLSFVHVGDDGNSVDIGAGAEAGFSQLFENAAFFGGQEVNARVTIDEIVDMSSNYDNLADPDYWGQLEYLDNTNEERYFGYDDWYLAIETNSIPGTSEARAQITIDFEDPAGNPVSIGETFFNVYDVDDNQFVEFSGFTDYYVTEDSILDVSIGTSGWTRFAELNGVGTDYTTADPRTRSRVMVRYVNVSSITFVVGTVDAADDAYFDIESGLGSTWVSDSNPTGDVPEAQPNLADPPPVADLAPRVSEISHEEISTCTPTTVTLTGSRLSVALASVNGIPAMVLSSSDTQLILEIPAGLEPGAVNLRLVGSLGTALVQNAFVASVAQCDLANAPAFWTKKISAEQVKMYAKNIVGIGKVQFLVNGAERSWIRASDSLNPKLRSANGFYYLVRTIDLVAGKNRMEIYLEGVRVWRATYSRY